VSGRWGGGCGGGVYVGGAKKQSVVKPVLTVSRPNTHTGAHPFSPGRDSQRSGAVRRVGGGAGWGVWRRRVMATSMVDAEDFSPRIQGGEEEKTSF